MRFISSQQLARAGFYYFNRSDHVRCAWCQGEIGKWEINDNPFTEHLRFFPNCLWAQLGPNVEVSSEESISNLGIQHIRAPKKERYSSLDARIRSFANWPMSSIQSPNYLATAGFYYQNTDDQVRCFQCNGGLRSWQREDDAWFEHGRWFPKCEFVQLVKGKQYIAQVQQQSRPTLDEALASEPVQKALEMGLNAGRVRAVTKYHLEHFGGPFKCAEALIDAVLDYQREEEHRQRLNSDNDEDDDNAESSSAIVREVGRILDTIFKHSRNTSGTTISASSSLSPTASTSVSNMTTSEDIHPAPQSTRGDTEPTIRVTDDFVVVEIPQRTSSIDSNNQCNFDTNPNEQINSDEWGSAAAYSNITKSNDTKTQQYNQINPTPSTSFVPENCIISNAEVPSTANSAIFEATAHSTQSHSKISQPMESDKSMSLEEENRQLKDARLCKVCMDGDVAVVFLPCGHLGKLFNQIKHEIKCNNPFHFYA